LISVTNSENARLSFEKFWKTYAAEDLWHAEYYVIWNLWEESFGDLQRVACHLKGEIGFLDTISQQTKDELHEEIEKNLQIAARKLEALQKMTPHEYYMQVLENPDFPKQMSVLPYYDISESNKDAPKSGTPAKGHVPK